MSKKTQRIDKILSNSGRGSRREIKQMVKNGLVTVDGVWIKDEGMHVDPEAAVIYIDGELFEYREFMYLMMNKPVGVISATTDNHKRTVLDIIPERYKCFDLFPAGRLDIDTEGLLVLTNDGQLAHEILSPKKHVPKKYYALVEGNIGDREVELFKTGVVLDDGYKTMPAELTVIRGGTNSEIELILHEGKFHQVKRMFEATGSRVTFLKRLEMGGLVLDPALKLGDCRELSPDEVEKLKQRFISVSEASESNEASKGMEVSGDRKPCGEETFDTEDGEI
ncbi:MAG: rRNA pseudouridine synthase [Clostridiales bacterium]|nr:rRNA pseudouridine synthase [Clostridiales bacterium]